MDFIKDLQRYNISELAKLKDNITLPGVYVLFKNNDIIYIGKSTDILFRLNVHIRNKEYNYFSVIICDTLNDADFIERNLINKYKPLLNQTFKKRPYNLEIDTKIAKYFNVSIESLIKE